MSWYERRIGLEIHLKLNTPNKLFCRCKNEQDFDNLAPNSNICPTCTWQPGALPSLSGDAVEKAVRLGKSLGCTIHPFSQFDRKSYFYPDLPAGFQITQFYKPYATDGIVHVYDSAYENVYEIRIKEAHLENDTGKTIHAGNLWLLDFNRAGTPLVEIVTEPDFSTEDEVIQFLKELQRSARINDIWYADLEKGQMRVDVNISIRKIWETKLGTRVELKNLNSFGAIKRAINHEYERQVALLSSGQEFTQETRGRDDQKNDSYSMRSKESAVDYRYFPEPDLPRLAITEEIIESATAGLRESTSETINRMKAQYQFNKEFINGLINNKDLLLLFEELVKTGTDPKVVAKYLVGTCLWYLSKNSKELADLPCKHERRKQFFDLIEKESIRDNQGKLILEALFEEDNEPKIIAEKLGFLGGTDAWFDLESIAKQAIENNPQAVADFRAGKQSAIWFLVGQVMKNSQWKANPNDAKTVLERLLG